MRQSITLIGCGKAKQPQGWNGPARSLYTGCLFKARRHFAESCEKHLGHRWAIVSAEHGLIWPNECLSQYDTTIRDLTKLERSRWALKVAGQLLGLYFQTKPIEPPKTTLALHIGRDYADLLIPVLDSVGFTTIWVTKGKSQGEQLQWYSGLRKMQGEELS